MAGTLCAVCKLTHLLSLVREAKCCGETSDSARRKEASVLEVSTPKRLARDVLTVKETFDTTYVWEFSKQNFRIFA